MAHQCSIVNQMAKLMHFTKNVTASVYWKHLKNKKIYLKVSENRHSVSNFLLEVFHFIKSIGYYCNSLIPSAELIFNFRLQADGFSCILTSINDCVRRTLNAPGPEHIMKPEKPYQGLFINAWGLKSCV